MLTDDRAPSQLSCHGYGTLFAALLVTMFHPLMRLLALMALLAITANAQTRNQVGLSLPERARQLEPYFVDSARRHNIDPRILRILCFIESRYRVNAVSPKGARGPMQLMPDTARRYGVINPHEPKQAIEAAAQYIRDLLAKFRGRLDLALAAYNAGEGTVQSFLTGRPLVLPSGRVINPNRVFTGGVPPYKETQNYVRQAFKILRVSAPLASRSTKTSTLTAAQFGNRDFTFDVTVEDSTSKELAERTAFIAVP